MKDHEIALLINQVRDVAKEYGQTQQLRERIAGLLVPVLTTDASALDLLETLLDVWDDEQHEPETRCYVPGTWNEVLAEARALVGAQG